MTIRTFYWHDRVRTALEIRVRRALGIGTERLFLTGNAGDIFTESLLRWHYGCGFRNVKRGGRRLLLVGSIAQCMQDGDIACGIGVKSMEIPKAKDLRIQVLGLRGPVSYEAFRQAGHDVSDVKFLRDPGLMIRFIADTLDASTAPRGAIFIPHYRERDRYRHRLPKGIRFVDIDNTPLGVAAEILAAELVYASSLHGVIFAHALNRPCVLVKPQTEEPWLKYEDYFASIDQQLPTPLGAIGEARLAKLPDSPLDLSFERSDFIFPRLEQLQDQGIAT